MGTASVQLTDALRKSLSSDSHRPALREGGRTLSRGELLDRAEGVARELSKTDPDSPPLAVDAGSAGAFLVEIIGARLAGRSLLVHGPGMPERLKRLREETAARLRVAGRTIFYSSGSLGVGRPVPLADSQMLFAALAYSGEAIEPSDRIALGVSIGYVFGFVRGALNSLLVGAEVIPFAPGRDPVADAEAAGGSVAILSTRHLLLAARSRRASSLKVILTGGAPLSEPAARFVEEQRGVPVRHGYGLTETSGVATRQAFASPRRPGTSGRPAQGMRIDVVGKDGSSMGPEEEGEIRMSGPAVFDGYADPEEPSPFDEKGRLRTGDIGRFDEEGEVVVRGRVKLSVWRKGRLLCAEELETAALEEEAVIDAAAVPYGEALGLLLVAEEASPGGRQHVLDDMGSRLPAFARPSRVRFVEEIPRRPSGKIDRLAVASLLGRP